MKKKARKAGRAKRRHGNRRKGYKVAQAKRWKTAVRVAERKYRRAQLVYRRAGCELFETRERARRAK